MRSYKAQEVMLSSHAEAEMRTYEATELHRQCLLSFA